MRRQADETAGGAGDTRAAILDEARRAYAGFGIALGDPVAYGTYYRLCCTACGRLLGHVGDRLLPGMAADLIDAQFDLYAAGLLGCACGHQRERARAQSPERFQAASERLGHGER